MLSLEEKLNSLGVNAMELGARPASLEQHEGVDYTIIFDAIETIATSTKLLDGFGETYDILHDINESNVYDFLEEAERHLQEEPELFEALEDYIMGFAEDMLEEARDSN